MPPPGDAHRRPRKLRARQAARIRRLAPVRRPHISTQIADLTVLYCKDQSATTRPSLLHTWHVSLLSSSRLNSKLQANNFPHTQHAHTAKQHAHAAELLLPYLRDRPAARVLDVGAGSGYFSSVCYHLVRGVQQGGGGGGSTKTSTVVVGIEHIPALTALAEQNIRADGLGGALDEQAIVLVTGDGRLGASLFIFIGQCLTMKFWWGRVRAEGPV